MLDTTVAFTEHAVFDDEVAHLMSSSPDVQMVVQLARGFFQRNNPVMAIVMQVNQLIDFVVNFQSHKKLMKYRFMLYKHQMDSLENNLTAGASAPRGAKMDRLY